jgi:serine/threonine-protein kinase
VLKEFILPVYVDVNVRKSALEQFENEARILRQLDHPQIVKLVDYFVEDHRAYLVLEHIDGKSLQKIVEEKGPLPEGEVVSLAKQMCKILEHLHGLSPPVVHRDFTPDNLILSSNGVLKLIDFNVAQQQESTTSGTVVGKQAYLPPEQFRGMPTSQSDIYSMGATLHFLLTGQEPEPISVSHPKRVNASVSEKMNSLVEHSTAIDCSKRYEKIEHLERDLMD